MATGLGEVFHYLVESDRHGLAMVLPIASAAAALGVATGLVRLGSNLVTISDVAPVLGVLLGLGVETHRKVHNTL